MGLRPDEVDLTGSWVVKNGRVIADAVEFRIHRLTTEELRPIAGDSSGREHLYQDPSDGRFWELTHPKGELQGGGPQALRILSADAALEKYGVISESEAAPPG